MSHITFTVPYKCKEEEKSVLVIHTMTRLDLKQDRLVESQGISVLVEEKGNR